MRRKKTYQPKDDSDIPMSPLIDCVFLLLIFFLVTTVIKRQEMQIPISLPDSTSSLSSKANEELIIIGVDVSGGCYRNSGKRTEEGHIVYSKINDLALYLKKLVDEDGEEILTRSLRLDIDSDAEFQISIDALDICTLQGFENVSVRMRQKKAKK